ncbi:hypothetical protein HDV06_001401 [Boothiomyces sp. JEL0866]|nr:hypothetical protein HDV06_001401 [Boothiomyces sp. JEL0866]
MDDELAQLRAKRLAEMKAQSGQGMGLPAGMTGQPQREDQEKQNQMEDMRHNMLAQILSGEARERLARIRIVKEDKARGVEDMIIRMAQTGQIRGKVSESQLVDLLSQISEQQTKSTKIQFSRRRSGDDSDDDDFGL